MARQRYYKYQREQQSFSGILFVLDKFDTIKPILDHPLDIGNGHFCLHGLGKVTAFGSDLRHTGKPCVTQQAGISQPSGQQPYGNSTIGRTRQHTAGHLAHKCLTVGTTLARYHDIGSLHNATHVQGIEQHVGTRASAGLKVLHEGISQSSRGTSTRIIRAVETKVSCRHAGKLRSPSVKCPHILPAGSLLRSIDFRRTLWPAQRIVNIASQRKGAISHLSRQHIVDMATCRCKSVDKSP